MTRLENPLITRSADVKIPMRDGVALAATLFLPERAEPGPAVLCVTPYRKDDYISHADEAPALYFAERGYASLVVDMRGCGSSEGVRWPTMDHAREAEDSADAIEWIAAQPWCDGNVGMWGVSYSGITTIHAAAAQPPHLKAIAPIMFPVDRYDTYFPGGSHGAFGAITWTTFMHVLELLPPGLRDVQGKWYELWRARLEAHEPRSLYWRTHRSYDEFWRSRKIDVSRIQAPTFVIGAWKDIFTHDDARLFEDIQVPRKLLLGPWEHNHPNVDKTATTDHLKLVREWFDRWLKHEEPASDEEPVTIYVYGAEAWRAEPEWPLKADRTTLFLAPDRRLETEPGATETPISYVGDPTVGSASLLFDGMGTGLARSLDQGPDDLRSLTFDLPIAGATEITGSPEATLFVELEEGDELNLVVKLCDVAPNGASTLITVGCANALLPPGGEQPVPFAAGEVREVKVALRPIAYQVAPGHTLRVSVACADFPRLWPTPTTPRIRLLTGGDHASAVHVPVVGQPGRVVELPVPDPTFNLAPTVLDYRPHRTVEYDVARDGVRLTIGQDWSVALPSVSGRMRFRTANRFEVTAEHPEGAWALCETNATVTTDDGRCVEVHGHLRETRSELTASATIEMDGQPLYAKQWRA